MQPVTRLLARWYFSSLLGRPEHKLFERYEWAGYLGSRGKRSVQEQGWTEATEKGEASLMEKDYLANPTRMEILNE